jgi:hypothetical protein
MNTLRTWLLASLAAAAAATAGQAQAALGPLSDFGTRAQILSLGLPLTDGGPHKFSAHKAYHDNTVGGAALANLVDGTLHASDVAFHDPCEGTCDYYGLTSRAAMWDSVYFLSHDGGPRTSASLIPLSIVVDGTLDGVFASAKMRSYVGFDRTLDPETLDWVDLASGQTQLLDNIFIPLTEDEALFIYVEISTTAQTNGEVDTSSEADFGHTLHFSWELPDDLTAVSASGVFLSDVSAAPEPAAWALMITGFGAAGTMLRARRRRLA